MAPPPLSQGVNEPNTIIYGLSTFHSAAKTKKKLLPESANRTSSALRYLAGSAYRPTSQHEPDDVGPSVDTTEVGKAMARKGGHLVTHTLP